MKLREEFGLDPDSIYLNSGSISICPISVLDAMERHLRDYECNPTASLFGSWARLWAAQKELAAFLGADPHDLFLRPNVTLALNDFILGIPLKKGSPGEILVSDLEYGAIVNVCRLRAEREELTLRTLELPMEPDTLQSLTPDELVNRVVKNLRPETRMLMLSHVMTGTGLALPIAKIAKETRTRGILFVVDGAHGPGALEVNFQNLDDLDFYGGNCHKWMMGPKGTGFGWVPKRHQSALQPIQGGWTTFEVPPVFQTFGDGNPFTSRFLWSSSQNFAPFFALSETVRFWERHGKKALFERIRQLQSKIEMEMESRLGWPLLSPTDPSLRGPLLAFDLPPNLQAEGYGLMERLWKSHRIQVSTPPVRGNHRLRFSPHVYNTEAEIERAIATIAAHL